MTFTSIGTAARGITDRLVPCEIVSTATGKNIAWAALFNPANRWPWVQRVVAEWAGCEPGEVQCLETEDGEYIIARGAIVARIK